MKRSQFLKTVAAVPFLGVLGWTKPTNNDVPEFIVSRQGRQITIQITNRDNRWIKLYRGEGVESNYEMVGYHSGNNLIRLEPANVPYKYKLAFLDNGKLSPPKYTFPEEDTPDLEMNKEGKIYSSTYFKGETGWMLDSNGMHFNDGGTL